MHSKPSGPPFHTFETKVLGLEGGAPFRIFATDAVGFQSAELSP